MFGYDDFRPGQAEIISAVLAGGPVLAVMPTGSGKSMCYQLPALIEERLTVVVSPLIALMRDQVTQLRALGVSAATLNSMNAAEENAAARRAMRDGELRLLSVSPDRQIGAAVEELGGIQAIGLTATADKATRADIAQRLFSTPPEVFLHSFDRPNIELNFAAKDQPRRQLARFLDRHRGASGIVYCGSRDRTERLADYFAEQGHEAVAYHAGLDQSVRNRNQDRKQT